MHFIQIAERMDELRQEIKRDGQALLKEAFSGLFQAWPELTAVAWTQYAPYFNDGEACVFSVHGLHYCLNASDKELSEDLYDEPWSELWSRPEDGMDPELHTQLKDFSDAIQKVGDTMQDIFGDGVKITATRKGIEIEDYSHD